MPTADYRTHKAEIVKWMRAGEKQEVYGGTMGTLAERTKTLNDVIKVLRPVLPQIGQRIRVGITHKAVGLGKPSDVSFTFARWQGICASEDEDGEWPVENHDHPTKYEEMVVLYLATDGRWHELLWNGKAPFRGGAGAAKATDRLRSNAEVAKDWNVYRLIYGLAYAVEHDGRKPR
ncbi:MAG: hypothetical protein ACHREM_13585 [Polyangiales bacterium]